MLEFPYWSPSYSGKDYLPSLTLLCGIKYSTCKQRMNLTGVSTVMGFGHAPTLTTLTKSVTGLCLFRISPANFMNDDVHVLIKLNAGADPKVLRGWISRRLNCLYL